MAAGALLFALMNFLARLASASASWPTVAACRALVGAGVAVAVAKARGVSLRVTDGRTVFWRSFFGTVSMLATFYALSSRSTSLGDVVTLLNLSPVFLALLAPALLGERTSAATSLALALAVSGVVLVVRPTFLFGAAAAIAPSAGGPSPAMTASVALLASMTTAIAMTMLRRVGQTESPEAIAVHFSLFAAFACSALALLLDPRVPTARDLACMVGAGLAAGVAQLLMTRAYTIGRAARVGSMSYLAVVASALLGAGVLGEVPAPLALAGMALVIGGGLVVTFARA